ncbi:sensor histidine kinase [Ruegeria sp. 2205SS24-7]|uniref:sensor histidine kinase n=1 Tax=Ruegeria discodermiae TaxID=3064389 RepID=UPI0027413124|nr:sensor histidine kinase [Ruegeria sp. 2205SS24-7]MDP5220906.1 sensor histidine kinase [Ruegeria sp. 2205SS24-7]
MRRSLTARVVTGAIVWITLALGFGGYAIYGIFQNSAQRQFDLRLEEELTQLTAAVVFSPEDIAARMTSPAFARSYSGLYWQAVTDDRTAFRSRSTQGWTLPQIETAELSRGSIDGPDGQTLRWLGRSLISPDGKHWALTIAQDSVVLSQETAGFRKGLILSAIVLAFALVSAAVLLLRTALSPLRSLRASINRLQAADGELLLSDFPAEVRPLVTDLNEAFEKNSRLQEKSRMQAANLAHALKTPAAVLNNEIDRLDAGKGIDTAVARTAIDRIAASADAHLRTVGPADLVLRQEKIDVGQVVKDLLDALSRLFREIHFDLRASGDLRMMMATSDLQEVAGNLLENAGKWASKTVDVTIAGTDTSISLRIEDDGPGVPVAMRCKILEQGTRLDESKPGTGLGLAIVEGVVESYGGTLTLSSSRRGGVLAEVILPRGNLNAS